MTRHPMILAYGALAAVSFFWGTTYAGIRMALEMFAPLQLMAFRFVLSGVVMLALARIQGAVLPKGRELWLTALYGLIALGVGNFCLTYAETFVPSGLASIIIATSPFWMVGLEAVVPGGTKLHAPTVAGMLVGLTGVGLLFLKDGQGLAISPRLLTGILILQLGCFGWCLGAILQRRMRTKVHPAVSGAVQQLAVGLVSVIPALALPQPEIHFSWRGLGAMLYLVVFGSIVGYTAFVYAMAHLPVALVSLYMYINPVVAVILGALIFQEAVGLREIGAMGVIFLGSAMVKWFTRKKTVHGPQPQPEPAATAAE